MAENDKLIQEWQEKVRASFGDASRIYQYLFETLDNFYYRYLETTTDRNLKTKELSPMVWGAESFETDMVAALKVSHPETKLVIMDLAKSVPKAQGPKIRYALYVKVSDLTADKGQVLIVAEVQGLKTHKKETNFKYNELAQFRKELALKLEETCEIFL